MLQTRTIEPRTLGLLNRMMAMPAVEPFFLVGGTALALQMGHRISIDLDLFTPQPFDKNDLLEALSAELDVSLESEGASMLITYIEEVKVDFVKMGYPVLFPPLVIEGVRMLDIRDIAPMKLKAVVQRGSKKDFYDIFFLLDRLTLSEMLRLFQEKFKQQEIFHVIKSLTYFEDAEKSPDPVVFDPSVTWQQVKTTVRKAVSKVAA